MITTLLALAIVVHPVWHERWAIVNGPEFTIVGKAFFQRWVASGSCVKVEKKRYPDQHVIVHICDV